MKLSQTSWKSTVTGIVTVLFGLGPLIWNLVHHIEPNWLACLGTITGGVGLIFARDNDKSSEDVGLK